MQLGKFCFLFFFSLLLLVLFAFYLRFFLWSEIALAMQPHVPQPSSFPFPSLPSALFFANLPFFFSFSIYSSFSFLCFLANVNQTVSNVIAGGKLKHAILLAASEAEARSAEALLKRAQ